MKRFEEIRLLIFRSLNHLCDDELMRKDLLAKTSIDIPKRHQHGDLSLNTALVFSKMLKKDPMQLGNELASRIESENISRIEVIPPGFINIRFKPNFWHLCLQDILSSDDNWGSYDLGKGQKINIEFVSANPTGPMHIGHARGAVIGDVLASMLSKMGYSVTREYYINDAGAQIENLALSLMFRYRQIDEKKAFSEIIKDVDKNKIYPGTYLLKLAQDLYKIHGKTALSQENPENPISFFRKKAIEGMLRIIKQDLAVLGVEHDNFFSEKTIIAQDKIAEVIGLLGDKGLIYEGYLDKPKGNQDKNWRQQKQLLFRSTNYGDDTDRALKKSDGGWTYFAKDIAYHFSKCERKYDHLINIWGADHAGYIKRMQAAVSALSDNKISLEVKLVGIVNLIEGDKQLKMSKRKGKIVSLKETMKKVPIGAIRFTMLTRKDEAILDFNLSKAIEETIDNPVFYVQYAHARCCSVLRKMSNENSIERANLSLLREAEEIFLIKHLSMWQECLRNASLRREPHRLTYYLEELARLFHSLWNEGNKDTKKRILNEKDLELSLARLALVSAVKMTIASGLDIIGIKPLDELRG